LYVKINNKKRNSKNFKQALINRDNLTNYYINQLNLNNINGVIIEDLKNVKHKSSIKEKIKNEKQIKFTKNKQREINDMISRWVYPSIMNKIERICEERGIVVMKVSPSYTSQTCSKCDNIDKDSRKGESFRCISCGYEIDADLNASINIYNRGIYSFSNEKRDI